MYVAQIDNDSFLYTTDDAWYDDIVETYVINNERAYSRLKTRGYILWSPEGVQIYGTSYDTSSRSETVRHPVQHLPCWLLDIINEDQND